MLRGQIRCIPDLLWYQADSSRKVFERAQIRFRITAGGKLVMASFTGQQRPCASDAPAVIRLTVITLAVTVVVVAVPTRAEWCLHFEHRIHNTK